MRDANFFAVFVGIESPDEETLKQMRKKQNTRRDIPDSVVLRIIKLVMTGDAGQERQEGDAGAVERRDGSGGRAPSARRSSGWNTIRMAITHTSWPAWKSETLRFKSAPSAGSLSATRYLRGAKDLMAGVTGRVRGPDGRVTLTARKATIPISLLNPTGHPLFVRVRLESDQLLFPLCSHLEASGATAPLLGLRRTGPAFTRLG